MRGETGTGIGVHGMTDEAPGVAVRAEASAGATALDVVGPAAFSSSGLTTIPKDAVSVVVAPGFDITEESKVLATLQSDPGKATIQHVERDSATDTFTIRLTDKAKNECAVAWFVIS